MAHIVIILDKSGSMESNSNTVINGFNEFLQSQMSVLDDTTFTLITFSDSVNTVFEHVNVANVRPLTKDLYITSGMTALYDAIGSVAVKYKSNPKTLVVVITDGQENASSTYSSESIEELISTRTAEGWKFIYLCTDLTTAHAASRIGMASAVRGARNPSTQNLMTNPENFRTVLSRQVSAATSAYRDTNQVTSIDELSSGVSQMNLEPIDSSLPPRLSRMRSNFM